MNKMYVGFNDIKDALTQRTWELLRDCLLLHIQGGGVVVVELRAENANLEFVALLDSEEKLKAWISK